MLKRGDIIKNRYTVKGVLSTGKDSNVYVVDDNQMMKEWVMKEFIISLSNPQMIEKGIKKFEKEVIILAGLKHSSLPEIIDYFSMVDRQYLVMEYIKGKTLAQVLEGSFQPMYEPDVLRLGIQIASAMSFLHKQSPPIIFRDLTPDNIMITMENQVKLIDFGLGIHFKNLQGIHVKKDITPGYAPPEQYSQEITDQRTDIYALGAILHQLLTLRDPSALSNVFKFPPVTSLNPKVSKGFEDIIGRATEYRPQDRYGSMNEMRQDMDTLLNRRGQPMKENGSGGMKTTMVRESPIVENYRPRPEKSPTETYRPRPEKYSPTSQEDFSESGGGGGLGGNIKIIGIVLFAVFLGLLAFFYINREAGGKKKETVSVHTDSPFADIQDKRILEYREKGITAYRNAVKDNDEKELAVAQENLNRVVTANPNDVECQVYLENTYILVKKAPYVKIAAILSLTGQDFESGRSMLSGIFLAQSLHNKKNAGKKMFIEIYDSKSRQEEIVLIAGELNKRNDILAIIGPQKSPQLNSMAKSLQEGKGVILAPTANCTEIENMGKYVFRVVGRGTEMAGFMADVSVNKLQMKKIAIMYDPAQSYSKIIGQIYEKSIKDKGVEYEQYDVALENQDYSDVIEKIKQFNPDGIFYVGYQTDMAVFAQQARKEGISARLMATSSIHSPELITKGGNSAEGIIFCSYYFPGAGEGSQDFIQRYEETFPGVEPVFRSALSYDTGLVVALALENGIETPDSMVNFLIQVLGRQVQCQGATGDIIFDKNGNRESPNQYTIIVKDGKFVLYQ